MLYQISDGTVSLGGTEVLSHIHFEIKGTEKIAVTGINGAGKTTLLRLLAGDLELDRDDKRQGPGIFASRRLTVEMPMRRSMTSCLPGLVLGGMRRGSGCRSFPAGNRRRSRLSGCC